MTAEELFNKVLKKASDDFGLTAKNNGKDITDPSGNSIIRKNISEESFKKGKAYFGFLSGDEETSGIYSDFSFVVFPNAYAENEVTACVVALGVGSSGFKNDYHLATLPGTRRLFLKLKEDDKTFFKTSFDDIESTSSDLLKEIGENHSEIKEVIKNYKNVLPASIIVDFKEGKKGLNTIYKWLATYAKMREWGNKKQKENIENQLKLTPKPPEELRNVTDLLESRKYVVLQGAPGTGKTYTALKIAKNYNKVFFEQFHAETNYSDFVYGLEPNIDKSDSHVQFKAKEGILYKAIKYAHKHYKEKEKVLLIIDEINRANLSNVLGPVFYLFEYQSDDRNVEIKVGDMMLKKLPENLHVIATMNTADRSLAVVDFALRRRFAWYTLRPHEIKLEPASGKAFMNETYNNIADIFFEFATDDELNLQPGQSYFIVNESDKDSEMKKRLIYELMPLIKEYLAEGYLLKAKDSFCDFFLKETGLLMYE